MDHYGKVTRKKNPRERANILSLLTFSYTGGLFRKGVRRDLEEEDIYEVVEACRADKNADNFERQWRVQRKTTGKVSLAGLVWKCFGWKFVILGIIQCTWKITASVYEPQAIGRLVSYFNPNTTDMTFNDAKYYAAIMVGLKFFQAIYTQNYIIYLNQIAMQMRVALCSLVYRKAIRMTPASMSELSIGNIITVITKDIPGFERFTILLSELWIDLIKIFVICFLIYNKMGPIGLVGVAFLIGVLPLQIYIGKVIKNLRTKLNKKTDERLQVTQEALSAIKIIKMYTWEFFFAKKVEENRSKEMKYLMKTAYLRSMNFIVGIFTYKVGLYVLLMTYITLTEHADAEVIFYVLGCFADLNRSLGIMIPIGLGMGAEMLASTQRINRVLNCEELDINENDHTEKPKVKAFGVTIKVKEKAILTNISIELKPGLTVVTGPLGSGKSTLLKLFLKDFPVTEGKIQSQGSFSYASQDSWLFPSSIKQNIIFGELLDEARYAEVVRVCALEYDFNLFDHGDETIVADGGKNLSGGQQARVNLARAIYKKSDIYLLDDPLHALDPKVQEYIFQNCIKNFLSDAIVVLVTHNLKYKNVADNLIVLKEGEIVYEGSPLEIKAEIIKDIEIAEKEAEKEEEPDNEDPDENTRLIKAPGTKKNKVYKEIKKIGKVDFAVYKKYFAFGGGFLLFSAISLMFIVAEFSNSYSTKILTNWINIEQNVTNLIFINPNMTNSTTVMIMKYKSAFYLKLYSGMIIASFVVDLIKQFLMVNFSRKASVNLHNSMIERLTTATMVFYDNYFIGNILNRFSQDLSVIDEHLPHTINMFVMITLSCVGVIGLVATVNYMFLIPAGVLILILFLLRKIYMPTARSIKRLEAATRSPLIGHLNASVEGVTTIRASRAQEILAQEFDRHQDLYISSSYMMLVVRRAFAFFMDIVSATFITIIIGKFLFFEGDEKSGDVGLAITKAASLTGLVQFALMQWSDLENDMTSVERVLEYTEIKQDKYDGSSLENWPSNAAISFNKVSLTYKLERVLKEITLDVKAKHKIGVVGRTGAGKSSIIATLFRLYDYEGTILIDGVDIKTLSLECLRSKISLIPQDPLLFQGTIRQNIDPLKHYSDDEIWTTLEKVYLRDYIHSLELAITDHGSNFSTGQRQLICLARAIIRKNKIVILDEATANMDPDTEFLVQKAIADNFADCTVLIIAHRLKSVLDCNKILVLEKGEVIEYASPEVLLKKKHSYFSKMLMADQDHSSGK